MRRLVDEGGSPLTFHLSPFTAPSSVLSLITALCSLDWALATAEPRNHGTEALENRRLRPFPPKKTSIVAGFIGMNASPSEGMRVPIADDLRTVVTSLAD